LLNRFLLVPFISIFVLPIAWFEGRLLPKAGRISLAGALTLLNALVLYVPWAIAIIATRHLRINPVAVLGFFMIAVGFIVLSTSLFPILRVPGQTRSLPESLVVKGPYRHVRHPIYLSHFLLIGGAALACGALKVYLETPIVLGIAAIGGKYEESRRLAPLFGRTFEQYRAKTNFLLPVWGWIILGLVHGFIAFHVFFL
jgi:protein-S-isoprenylcysteine O-methyltransferase Ste14